jgi:hypothetical protein
MRTIQINLYKFQELSKESKQKALESLSDINTDFEWWEAVFEDAENVGLKITGFDDVYYCSVEFIHGKAYTAHKIEDDHGESTNTYKCAVKYLEKLNPLNLECDSIENEERENEIADLIDRLDDIFEKELIFYYHAMLKSEYEYKISEEAIIETIEANEYEFTIDGDLYHHIDNVQFLVNQGEVFAYFPDLIADHKKNKLCYSHIGQHSACSEEYAKESRPATKEEYKDLFEELTNSVGYNLNIIQP